MDTIQFEITDIRAIKDSAIKSCEVAMLFNGQPIPDGLFNAAEVIAASHFNIAEFDLFTCTCGVPGCAGYHSRVKQAKENGVVSWEIPEEYRTDKQEYLFDSEQFSEAFKSLFSRLEELERDKIYVSSNFRSVIDDEDIDPVSIRKGVDWLMDQFQADENLNVTLKNFKPDLYGKEFFVRYGDEVCRFKTDLHYLVCGIMNQYPRAAKDNFYLAKAKLAAKAVDNLIAGDNLLFKKIVSRGYKNNGLSAFNFIDRYIYSIKEEAFDIDKIGLIVAD